MSWNLNYLEKQAAFEKQAAIISFVDRFAEAVARPSDLVKLAAILGPKSKRPSKPPVDLPPKPKAKKKVSPEQGNLFEQPKKPAFDDQLGTEMRPAPAAPTGPTKGQTNWSAQLHAMQVMRSTINLLQQSINHFIRYEDDERRAVALQNAVNQRYRQVRKTLRDIADTFPVQEGPKTGNERKTGGLGEAASNLLGGMPTEISKLHQWSTTLIKRLDSKIGRLSSENDGNKASNETRRMNSDLVEPTGPSGRKAWMGEGGVVPDSAFEKMRYDPGSDKSIPDEFGEKHYRHPKDSTWTPFEDQKLPPEKPVDGYGFPKQPIVSKPQGFMDKAKRWFRGAESAGHFYKSASSEAVWGWKLTK